MKSGETGSKTRRHQLGFSLIEAAVALSIVGLAATGLWQAMGGMWARESVGRAQSHMARAEAAVQSFAGIHGRLPCPAPADDGLEEVLGVANVSRDLVVGGRDLPDDLLRLLVLLLALPLHSEKRSLNCKGSDEEKCMSRET